MKFSICLLAVGLCAGCRSAGPFLTPSALTDEVSAGVAIGTELYPAAVPELQIAKSVICAEVGKTNVQPSQIIADLSAAGITNMHAKLIVDTSIIIYNTVFNLLTTNQTAAAQPYLDALCQGFTQALPGGPAARHARKELPPHLK